MFAQDSHKAILITFEIRAHFSLPRRVGNWYMEACSRITEGVGVLSFSGSNKEVVAAPPFGFECIEHRSKTRNRTGGACRNLFT